MNKITIDQKHIDRSLETEKLVLEQIKKSGINKNLLNVFASAKNRRGLYLLVMNKQFDQIKQLFFEGGLLYLFSNLGDQRIDLKENEVCCSILSGNIDLCKLIYNSAEDKEDLIFYHLLFLNKEKLNEFVEQEEGYLYNFKILKLIVNAFILEDSKKIADSIELLIKPEAISSRIEERPLEQFVSIYGLVCSYIAKVRGLDGDLKYSDYISEDYILFNPDKYFITHKFLFDGLKNSSYLLEMNYKPTLEI